jgi:uncharacterized protein
MRWVGWVCSAIFLLLGTADFACATSMPVDVEVHIPAPYAEAARVIRAAKQGDPRAQAYLGYMYERGIGVPQHFMLAAKWYRCAAEQGHGNAQFALGLLYNKGRGVPIDFVAAYMWMNLSASQAIGEDRDFKVRIRDAIASKMTVLQVEQAQQFARAWYKSQGL